MSQTFRESALKLFHTSRITAVTDEDDFQNGFTLNIGPILLGLGLPIFTKILTFGFFMLEYCVL
jgi:hypothetical protein